MQSTVGTYTTNRNLGKVKISKPISRAASLIGLLQFLLGVALLVSGILLYTRDVNDDIDASQPKFYGLWAAPGPLIVSVFGIVAWLVRRKDMIIIFAVVNLGNICLLIVHAVFLLPVTFWFRDFLTLSKCREQELADHGLDYDREGKDSNKRDCNDMNTIARLFLVLAVSCIFAMVISVGGIVDGVLGVRQMRKDQVDQMEGITNEEFRQMEQKTAMWLENNVRFSAGSTLARSEKSVSESALSTGPGSPGYKDKTWV